MSVLVPMCVCAVRGVCQREVAVVGVVCMRRVLCEVSLLVLYVCML